jgi:hypothetical protein
MNRERRTIQSPKSDGDSKEEMLRYLRIRSTLNHPAPGPNHVKVDTRGEVLGMFTNQYGSSALSEHLG